MMKLKKLACVALAALTFGLTGMLAACDNGDDGGVVIPPPDEPAATVTDKAQTYVMEAEYIDLTGVVGSMISGSAKGVGMIYGGGTDADRNKGWSEGYYIAGMHAVDCKLDFVFNSGAAERTTIAVRLSSEVGTMNVTPDSLSFKLNGEEVRYGMLAITGGAPQDLSLATFNDYTVSANITLKGGENTFSITVKQNNIGGTDTRGPLVDCVKFTTKSVLTWTDRKDNITKRDNPDADL